MTEETFLKSIGDKQWIYLKVNLRHQIMPIDGIQMLCYAVYNGGII